MSDFPKLGMTYEQVRTRLKKYDSIKKHGNKNLRDSLLRQAMLCDGEGAAKELLKEHKSENTARSGFSGRYLRSHGIGRCKIQGKEKYVYKDNGTIEKIQ